jgi:hypothetical protein
VSEDEKSKRPLTIGLGLITLAGLLIKSPDMIASIGQSPALREIVAWVSIAVGSVGLILMGAWGAGKIHLEDRLRQFRLWAASKILGEPDPTFGLRLIQSREMDLEPARDLCLRQIGSGLSPLKKMIRWHRHNREIFHILVQLKLPGDDLVAFQTVRVDGYFGVIPLRKSACQALDEDQLDGLSFTTEHICKPGHGASGYYIAGIAGRYSAANVRIVWELWKHIATLVETGPKVFYTRPVTKIGLKLVKEFAFERLDRSQLLVLNEICKKQLSKEELAARRARRDT